MSRRTDIEAAIAAHNSADRETLLPPDAARLLRAMFPRGSVCQRRLEDLAAEGSTEGPFPDCCAAWSMRGSCPRSYRAAFPAPTGCTCRRCGDESPLLVRRPGRQPRAALPGLRPIRHTTTRQRLDQQRSASVRGFATNMRTYVRQRPAAHGFRAAECRASAEPAAAIMPEIDCSSACSAAPHATESGPRIAVAR